MTGASKHMSKLLALALVALLTATSVGREGPSIQFENRQPGSGVTFVLDNGTLPDKPMIDGIPGGVALFDYDGDGYLDIFFTNGAHLPGLVKDDPRFSNHLYHNNHDGTFTDVTDRAGLRGDGYSVGAAAADFDNDGHMDLYVTGYNRNFLYHNNGDGTFTDVTEKAGVTGISPSGKKLWGIAAAWVDYDNDGKLDLFVTNASPISSTTTMAMERSPTFPSPWVSLNISGRAWVSPSRTTTTMAGWISLSLTTTTEISCSKIVAERHSSKWALRHLWPTPITEFRSRAWGWTSAIGTTAADPAFL
jgi:hypothetical protein